MKVPGILKNKYVCYALMALAALNVIGYLTVKAWECLALFLLTAYSAHCYCGNKSCAILAALFVANFVFGCGRVKEGFIDAFKGPMEHLQNARDSLFRAREGFEATAAACCENGAIKTTGLSTDHDKDHPESAHALCAANNAAICAAASDTAGQVKKVTPPVTSDSSSSDSPTASCDPACVTPQVCNNGQCEDPPGGFDNIF